MKEQDEFCPALLLFFHTQECGVVEVAVLLQLIVKNFKGIVFGKGGGVGEKVRTKSQTVAFDLDTHCCQGGGEHIKDTELTVLFLLLGGLNSGIDDTVVYRTSVLGVYIL